MSLNESKAILTRQVNVTKPRLSYLNIRFDELLLIRTTRMRFSSRYSHPSATISNTAERTGTSSDLHWLDLLIVAVITWMTFSAMRRGLIQEIVTLVALILGAVVAGSFYDDLSTNIEFLIDHEERRNFLAFSALLIGILILGKLIAGTLRKTARFFMLGPFDRIGGAAFGFIKGIAIVEVALIVISVFPVSETAADAIEDSQLATVFLEQAPFVELALPSEFENALDTLHEWQNHSRLP